MSTLKKVISIVLCISLLAGTVAFVGDLIVPKANAAAGTSNIKSYAELEAAYDSFIYLGLEAYEADGTLTDGYVQPGDEITFRMYIKSDRYMGNGTYYSVYDKSFFDVTNITHNASKTYTAYSGVNYETNSQFNGNSAHPLTSEKGLYAIIASRPASSMAQFTSGNVGIDASLYNTWDLVVLAGKSDTSSAPYAHRFIYDEYVYEWYATVKAGLADGTTGYAEIREDLFKHISPKKVADIPSLTISDPNADHTTVLVSKMGGLSSQKSYINEFNCDDARCDFTIGENPSSGANKYTAKFLENDGTELSASKYDVGAAVTVPDAAVNQLGWADTSTGKLVDLTDYVMPKKNVEFKRVLTTDTFPLVINLDGGAVDGANLPEGVTDNGDGTLTANVPLNTEFDLTAIPVPEKAGYTASWNPEKIAVNSIKGATAKVVWTANTYKATFYLNKGDAEPFDVIDIAYGATLTCSGAAKDGFKFAGWVDAATDSKVSSTISVGKYNFTENKSYYADWTEYACSIDIMVRDYANGGWKLAATKYADSGTLKLNDIKACATAEVLGWDAEIAATDKQVGSSPDGWTTDTNIKSDVSFEGDKVVYVYTKLSFEVTWKIPVYDAETDSYTDSFKDVAPVTVKTGYNEGVTDSTGVDAFTTYAKCSADYAAPLGYTMTGWYKTGSDEPSEYNDRLGIALTYSDGAKVEFTAKYELTKYDIIFNIRNGNYANKIKLDGALTKGESIVIEGASFTNASGKDSPVLNEAVLPTVGLENTQQPNGGYGGMDGYEFDGWVLGVGAYATELLAFPMEITSDMISQYAKNGAIEFNAKWTALEYDLKFYYKTSDGEWTDTPIVITLQTGSSIKKPSGADLDMIQANAPKGEKFTGAWLLEDGSADSSMTMPAFGRDYYAKYGTASLGAYIDYNSGKTDEEGQLLPLKDTMIRYPGLDTNPLNYADDAERKEDVDAGIKRGVAYDIMNAHISDTNKPGEFYEIVGWNVYHVDYGADVYNKDNWKPGYNDEGSTIAYSDIIFQAEWKSHDDFLFRVYDTDGKLYKAVGKNLKTYYWLNGYVSNRNDSKLNKSPDILVVLMLVPSVENWDVNRFFDIEMWRSLHLRFDAFALPKSMFTWESFKGLMEALGNAIRELIGSKVGGGDETTEGDVVDQATEAVNTQGFKFIG